MSSDESESESVMDYDLADGDVDIISDDETDPEFFDFQLMQVEDVERMLNELVESLCKSIKVSPERAKILLLLLKWNIHEVEEKYHANSHQFLMEYHLEPANSNLLPSQRSYVCSVCLTSTFPSNMYSVSCGHQFCQECWTAHFQAQLQMGMSTEIECMATQCRILVSEKFVLDLLKSPRHRDKYLRYSFHDYVNSHPHLRFCPGPNCQVIIYAKVPQPKRVICMCKTSFCFKCGLDYHAPTECETIKKWLTKCADDSETANYISANTKDCPRCQVCIEKNGGCNHMQCAKCRHDFCWMCLGEWKNHGSEYYECSRYKENPNIANESAHAQAREALKKYLFYFERWENHAKSLQLEEQTLKKIQDRINEKAEKKLGTWIDWQYLLNSADLLRKSRYTLQFTYPYAYYLPRSEKPGSDNDRCKLFEMSQAQLEAEVEELSWKIERAEITDRGTMENQMDIVEKRRLTLVKGFLPE